MDENFPSFFLASLRILQMRSPFWKLIGQTFVLYRLDAQILQAASRIQLLSRNSLTKSRLTTRYFSFRVRSNICLHMVGLPNSTGIMASAPYVKLYGVSSVVVWGCICTPRVLLSAPRSIDLLPCPGAFSAHTV